MTGGPSFRLWGKNVFFHFFSAGKTRLVCKIAANYQRLFGRDFNTLVLFYAIWQPLYEEFLKTLSKDIKVVLIKGPDANAVSALKANHREAADHTLVVFDDLVSFKFLKSEFYWIRFAFSDIDELRQGRRPFRHEFSQIVTDRFPSLLHNCGDNASLH